MQYSAFKTFTVLIIILLFGISCDTQDPFRIDPPDLTTVPDAYDLQNAEPVNVVPGVEAYIHEEGSGPYHVTSRDDVFVFLTLRTDEGDIIYSTFSDGRTDPIPVSMRIAGTYQNLFQQQYTILLGYTPGFKTGMLGMREGEKRTIVVQSEQGYGNVPAGNINAVYRNNTLIYDVKVSRIEPS